MAATLKDVAKQAGVSIKTVSNVVHNHPAIAISTRARVRAAIEALNYRPNVGARHLRRARVGVLALAIPDLSNSYFSDIGNAIITAAAERDYTVLIDHTDGDREKEALVAKGLRPHLIDGLILSSLAIELEDLQATQHAMPIVLLGERLIDAPYDHVMPDNIAAARLATSYLIGLGRRRIAVIGVQYRRAGMTAQMRLQGYRDAMDEAGLRIDPHLLLSAAAFHRADGAQAMRQLLTLEAPPDAVFCFNDLMALGAMRTLYESGYRIPDDVAVLGFDNIEEGLYAMPSLTTIAPDKTAIARSAVNLLLDRIQGTRTGPPERIEAPYALVVRESTPRPAQPIAVQGGDTARQDDVAAMQQPCGAGGVPTNLRWQL
ncbi:MAG TPA: LacI family DNA-binding transcriptional regulator [Chloroflexota bacterium]|nr:LacI family DNA-binding transcriptional regulator [Chloroflexota bacterium]